MKLRLLLAGAAALAAFGCSHSSTTQPVVNTSTDMRAATSTVDASPNGRPGPGRPGYEPAYEDGRVVTINAIDVPNHAPLVAQADFYEVVYPQDWQALGIAPPQCNPCDHEGNGIDPTDFHDHVLDSSPGDPGYRAPWHVYLLVPAYNGDAAHDAAIGALYKASLPIKSEDDVLAFAQKKLDSGAPVAVLIDTQFYFLCAIVGQGAGKSLN